jgi:hypothetical protein
VFFKTARGLQCLNAEQARLELVDIDIIGRESFRLQFS